MDGQSVAYVVADETASRAVKGAAAREGDWAPMPAFWPEYEAFLAHIAGYFDLVLDPRYGFVPDTFKSLRALNE
jgi:hypothetical protein